ncbi:MAG: hypothetical protein QNJ51_11350 [Calothrix sp. MO_167.B12]|nr:hypothetical protein [Calothrix sp. MO_167.B12]
MPVNVLYCEGNYKSIDIRVIRQIVARDCEIKPIGGKQLFISSIAGDRRINPNLAGLLDRDFDCQNVTLTKTPQPKFDGNSIKVGWTWERKEIENYLLDPEVVQQALGRKAPPMDKYRSALRKAAEEISTYTAARTALSCYGFKNFWGEEVKLVNTSHLFPRRLGKDACEQNIREIVNKYKGDRIVTPENVLEKFQELLPLFRSDGFRLENFLSFFAGKDLLYMMTEKLREFGFESSDPTITPSEKFIERIIKCMERAEEVWTWLPEWARLRELIINTNF